jgi:hypothetical protein
MWADDHQMPISIDDAIALVVCALREATPLSPVNLPNARHHSRGCDLRVTDVFTSWWQRENAQRHPLPEPGETDCAPFYEAAWELARRGILRSGPAFPIFRNFGSHQNTEGDGFSLTTAGREWVTKYDQQGPFPLDPSRFSILVHSYSARFGPAFIQRITEAAGCYRTQNYFAACAMAGAACETIVLALAIKKMGDEARAVKMYLGRDGRRTLINYITTNMTPHMKQGIETATGILSYWRDNAAHGHATQISEFAAHDALSRLLRFTQFVDGNWDQLIV